MVGLHPPRVGGVGHWARARSSRSMIPMRTTYDPNAVSPEWITTADGTDMYRVDGPTPAGSASLHPGGSVSLHPAGSASARPAAAGILSPQTWAEALYAVLDLGPAITFFVLIVTLVSLGIGLTVIYVGIPILMLALVIARLGGIVQVGLSTALLGMSVPLPGPFVRRRPGFAATLLAVVGDAAAWRSGGYFLIKIVLAPITFGLALGLYSFGLGAITYRSGGSTFRLNRPPTAPSIGVRSGGPTISWTPFRGWRSPPSWACWCCGWPPRWCACRSPSTAC